MRRTRWLCAFVALVLVAASCGRGDDGDDASAPVTEPPSEQTTTTAGENDPCSGVTLEATEVGVTATEITVTVMADTGSPLAPGLFQGNVDALNAYAEYINANGGIGCRDLVVKSWDSKLMPEESKNGLIDACAGSLAMVGGNSLFNPDVSPMTQCVDKAGAATGLPNIAALANDITEMCAETTYVIQAVAETCPVTPGSPRPIKAVVGPTKWYLEQHPGLHGLFMIPGDLPTTRQSAMPQIAGQAQAGITWDGTPLVSGRDEQPAYTPRIQAAKAAGSTYVYNGSNDRAMVTMRKEAKAQGLDSVEVWACSLACYTQGMLEGGADVEGTYLWMQFLPFEEADTNEELKAYVDSVGASEVDSFGAQAWQAAVAFKTVVDQIVEADGPNAITRAAILDALANIKDFDANGWAGKNNLRGVSDCFLIVQIQGGKFERVHPTERGTMTCDPSNVVTVTVDPAAEAEKLS